MPEAKRGKARGNGATPIFMGCDLGSRFLFSLPEAKRGNADFPWGATYDHQCLETGKNPKANAAWGIFLIQILVSTSIQNNAFNTFRQKLFAECFESKRLTLSF